MKSLAVLTMIVIAIAFALPVSAQCIDYASCIGEKAEIDARLRPWARETAVAAASATAEARQAIATQRAYDRAIQLTATEMARPTKTPVPTVTAQPSATSLPTVTPMPTKEPSATPNLGATVVSVAVSVLQRPQATPKPVNATAAEMERRQRISAILIIAIIAVLGGGVWFLIRVLTAKHTIEI